MTTHASLPPDDEATGAVVLDVDGAGVRRGSRELGPWSTTVRAGELQHWRGPNGSGKSTLMEIVAGLIEPHVGSVSISGRPLLPGEDPFERDVTMLTQEIGLWPRRRIGAQIDLVRVHATRFEPRWIFENVYRALEIEPFRNRRPESLSVGEQQRCALARALAKPASVVLLDEPFSAQDDASRERVERAIELVRESGAVVIISSHLPVESASSTFDLDAPPE